MTPVYLNPTSARTASDSGLSPTRATGILGTTEPAICGPASTASSVRNAANVGGVT